VHRLTDRALAAAFPGRFILHGRGPDFFDTLTQTWVELTTQAQKAAHEARYPGVPIATYKGPW
jgi:hypothetical protein